MLKLSPYATDKEALAIISVTTSVGNPVPISFTALIILGPTTANSPPADGIAKLTNAPVK